MVVAKFTLLLLRAGGLPAFESLPAWGAAALALVSWRKILAETTEVGISVPELRQVKA
jgi:hypothetical protein